MSDFKVTLDTARLRKDLINGLINGLTIEMESIMQVLRSNLDATPSISQLPDHWAEDVKEHLKYVIQDDEATNTVLCTIGVFDTDDGNTVTRPKDVLWKAMIMNYGMGLELQLENEFLREYLQDSDFNKVRSGTGYNMLPRSDTYYDPEKKGYVNGADSVVAKKSSYPELSHVGTTWWSDVYDKFLDTETQALKMVDDIVDRFANKLDWEIYFQISGYFNVNL